MNNTIARTKRSKKAHMQNMFSETNTIDEQTLIKPFLKWAGGKFRLVPELKKHFPTDGNRFIEPFFGAGSVGLNVNYPEIIVNDTLTPLYQVWDSLQKSGMKFVKEAEKLFIPENNCKEKYYEFRNEFNTTDDKLRKACLFIYLNRHCFNGLCRFNKKGFFNSPIGSYKNVYFPMQEFVAVLPQVKKFDIHNKDFRQMMEMATESDVVYCDPPYVPWSDSANFATYSEGGFTMQDQSDLAKAAHEASCRGATVVISNHYTDVTHKLYVETYQAEAHSIDVQRFISSKTEKRESVKEIIAVFKPKK